MGKREHAHRLFQCLAVSIHPLRVEELAEVLAMRFGPETLPHYHVSWRLEDTREAVLSACSSLVAIVNADGSPIVRFSQFSVKEYLTSERLSKAGAELSRYHIVAMSAHTVAKELIKNGADVSLGDKFGWTPLHSASRNGYPDILLPLLDHSANVNATLQIGWSSLHLAAANGRIEIVRLLIERRARVEMTAALHSTKHCEEGSRRF
jgi:hypothetical protein